jgi:hypothetical protein
MRLSCTVLSLFVGVLIAGAPAASAATSGYDLPLPVKSDARPAGFRLSPSQAVAAADRSPTVAGQRRGGRLTARVARLLGKTVWQIDYFRNRKVVARARVDGLSGQLIGRVWTGPYIRWPIARGTKTRFRDRLDLAVIVLAVLFVLPFVDPRRPFRMLHLDVLAMASFTVSLVLFNTGHLYASVPLQYPPLLYLLGRLLWLGTRATPVGEPAMPFVSERLLTAGVLLLLLGRIAFDSAWGQAGDVAYAGVFGADSIHHGWPLYTTVHPTHLDTYGPVNYLIYLPSEFAFPLGPGWAAGSMTAAHVTAITLDLIVVTLLMALGRKLLPGERSRRRALILAYAWVASPATFLPLLLSANDAINALFVLAALLAIGSPLMRGGLLALGGAAKFAPLALLPLFAAGLRRSWRDAAITVGTAGVVFVLAFLPYIHQSGFHTVWNSTMGFQLSRSSPFTLWGLHPSLDWLHPIVTAAALMIVIGSFFVPRERSLIRTSAMAAAVILVVQMSGNYWAHTYVMWFAGPAFLALIGRYGAAAPVRPRADAGDAPIAVATT